MNRALIRSILNKTPYELYFGRKPNLSHPHKFGCKSYVHNNGKDNLDKFDPRSNETWFIGYSSFNKAFYVFHRRILKIEESIYVVFYQFSSSGDRLMEEENQGDWMNIHTQTSPKGTYKQ